GVAGALLLEQLLGRVRGLRAVFGADRTLPAVGVVANERLLEQRGAHLAAEQLLVDADAGDLVAVGAVDWDLNHLNYLRFVLVDCVWCAAPRMRPVRLGLASGLSRRGSFVSEARPEP